MSRKSFMLLEVVLLGILCLVEDVLADSQVLFLPDREVVETLVLENELVRYEISPG